MEHYICTVGYCGVTADGLMGPTLETELQAVEAFMIDYPAVPERVVRVRAVTAGYDPDEDDGV